MSQVGIEKRVHPENIRVQHVINCRGPDRVLNGQSMRSVSGPKANHRVWFRERSMHVPLMAAVVREEIVDYAIETRPIGAVVSIRSLRAGNCDVCVPVTFDRGITSSLVSARESDLHESAVVRPRSEVPGLSSFIGGVRDNRIP